ncbi:MAG: DEAD/DEAH box helicase family protein, partial [Anaerolineaceae bacterium]
MNTDNGRPKFKSTKVSLAYASPEELFYKLSGRVKSHGYLRGPQQDVLREYAENHRKSPNVAFELPTGTGKTAVGLLIAEWRRLQSQKVAYLSLTNQLSAQVLEEARRLNLPVADLRGTKDTRNPSEEGNYRTGAAVAVTT